MSYRPITDVWILARPKVKYYGAYPAGFLGRARALLGVDISTPVLHVCSGKVEDYPYKGFGPNDYTLDIDPELGPDVIWDVREGIPFWTQEEYGLSGVPWPAILMDPPYTPADTAKYYEGDPNLYPNPRKLVADALKVVKPGGRVGILHYCSPRPPKGATLVAMIGVTMGYDNNWRAYTVYERES